MCLFPCATYVVVVACYVVELLRGHFLDSIKAVALKGFDVEHLRINAASMSGWCIRFDERRRRRCGGKHHHASEKRYELLSGVIIIAAVPFVTMFDRLTGRIVSGLAFELQCVVADQRHVWGCAKCPHTLSMSLFEPVSYHQ